MALGSSLQPSNSMTPLSFWNKESFAWMLWASVT